MPLTLPLFHSHQAPDEMLHDWGFDSSSLSGVKALKFTYGQIEIDFDSTGTCHMAQEATGWQQGVRERSLAMEQTKEFVVTKQDYFADWSLVSDADSRHP